MKIEAKGTLEPKDYVQANRLLVEKYERQLIAISLIFFLLIASPYLQSKTPAHLNPVTCILGLVTLSLFFGMRFYLPIYSRRLFKQQKDLQIEHAFQLVDEHFSNSSSIGNAQLDWSHFLKWKLGKDFVLLYRSDALMHILPKRYFKDGDFEILIEFLKTKLPQK